jgi:hypothetical protein
VAPEERGGEKGVAVGFRGAGLEEEEGPAAAGWRVGNLGGEGRLETLIFMQCVIGRCVRMLKNWRLLQKPEDMLLLDG